MYIVYYNTHTSLTLNVLVTTAIDNKFCYGIPDFQEKEDLNSDYLHKNGKSFLLCFFREPTYNLDDI